MSDNYGSEAIKGGLAEELGTCQNEGWMGERNARAAHRLVAAAAPTTEDGMTRRTLIVTALLLVPALARPREGLAQTFKAAKFSIGGDGGTDYLTAEPGTGRVFVSRGSHVMVLDGIKGTVIGDITETPNTHGIALAPGSNHGFITNRGDSTVTMFDLKTLAVAKKIKIPAGGMDGIMFDDFTNRVILTNHSKPGTATALDPGTGEITGQAELEDNAPEGAASD